jgi:hypothetical protein
MHYHYIQHLQKYDRLLQERGVIQAPIVFETLEALFSAEEWNALLEQTVVQKCQ